MTAVKMAASIDIQNNIPIFVPMKNQCVIKLVNPIDEDKPLTDGNYIDLLPSALISSDQFDEISDADRDNGEAIVTANATEGWGDGKRSKILGLSPPSIATLEDPVKMYMRGKGSVSLLSREDGDRDRQRDRKGHSREYGCPLQGECFR